MKLFAQKLLLPEGFQENCLLSVEDGRIAAIETDADPLSADVAYPILAPGYFDIHNHGGEGYDTTSLSVELLERFLIAQQKAGVTDILITLLTGEASVMAEELAFLRSAMALQAAGKLSGAKIRGAHLEGPFLNGAKNGAQDADQILLPSVEVYDRYFGAYTDVIRMVTVAPEMEGAARLARHLAEQGICVQAGHNLCDWETAMTAFDGDFSSVCHTFNACPPIHHRAPGLVSAALIHPDVYCEAICDLVHLHEGVLKLLYHCKGADRMVVISDSTMPTNLPDGRYFYAGQWAKVENGVKSTLGGALNGGICYLDGAVKNLISIGIPAKDALRMCSATPAARLGMADLGNIRVGAPARLVALSADYTPLATLMGGELTPCSL